MMSFAVVAIVKATLVCGVAFFLSRLCRRTRASIRHLLFALAFAALVAIPGAGTVLPAVAVTVPATATAPAPRTQDMASAVLSSAGADPSAVQHSFGLSRYGTCKVRDDRAGGHRHLAHRRRALPDAGRCRLLAGASSAPELRRHGPTDRHLCRRLRQRSACTDGLTPCFTTRVTGPMTCGVLRPSIILPASARAVG